MDRRALERRLEAVAGFAEPAVALEQYPTPPDVAAHLLHRAALSGDLTGHTVVDLGAGTGMLALAAAFFDPDRVIAVERDPDALAVARENERRVDPPTGVEWVAGDARSLPVCVDGATVVTNPPFGAQHGREGADRPFLAAAAEIAGVSYSLHNAGSQSFVESFARDHDGRVAAAYRVALDIDRQFPFHSADRETVDAEAYCVEWSGREA